jgi:hypothetical protein
MHNASMLACQKFCRFSTSALVRQEARQVIYLSMSSSIVHEQEQR